MTARVPDNTPGGAHADAAKAGPAPGAGADGPLAGRSGLLFPLVLAAASTWIVVSNATMTLPEGTDFPGPRFYPTLLAVAGYVIAVLLTLHYLRSPEHPEETTGRSYAWFSDWGALAWCAGGFLAFALLLDLLGWILAATLLFWCTARGMGSRRVVFDGTLGLVLGSAIYLAFVPGLGLNLPSGLLGGW